MLNSPHVDSGEYLACLFDAGVQHLAVRQARVRSSGESYQSSGYWELTWVLEVFDICAVNALPQSMLLFATAIRKRREPFQWLSRIHYSQVAGY